MNRRLLFLVTLAGFAITLNAEPPLNPKTSSKHEKKAEAQIAARDLAQSANGWNYVKGEWVHPNGYKYVNGKVVRTTARPGKPLPNPPGKLALENPEKLAAPAPVVNSGATEKARNLAPKPAPQTGSNIP